MLQTHLDGKKHAAKLRLLGGAEAFAPPKPLGPLPVNPAMEAVAAVAAAAAESPTPPAKRMKKEGI